MNIYVGYDFEHNPISILLAQNREQANITWENMLDMGEIPYSVEEINPEQKGIQGLIFVLTSDELKEFEACYISNPQ